MEEIKHLVGKGLNCQNSAGDPSNIIQQLVERKDESTTVLLNALDQFLDDFKRFDSCCAHLYALYILSYFREKRAFPYIIKIAQLPADWVEKLLGDHKSEGLASWIVSTYDGDLKAIENIIENETADVFCRISGMNALVGLVMIDRLPRNDVLSYFKKLIQSDLVKDHEFATFLVSAINDLYPQELYDDVVDLYNRDLIDTWVIDLEYVQKTVEEGLEKRLQESATCVYHLPITDLFGRISWMFHTNKPDSDDSFKKLIKLGRNQPCFCGSNKKYKKCCIDLVA